MAIKPYFGWWVDFEKTGGPTKQVERRGHTKSGPLIPTRFEDEHEHQDEPYRVGFVAERGQILPGSPGERITLKSSATKRIKM
jgi:hypothetical protein